MTAGELQQRVLARAGEDPSAPRYYTAAETLAALNEAQRVFCLLTLCLEDVGTLALTAGQGWTSLPAAFPRLLLPLRVRLVSLGKLLPARLQDLDARDPHWQVEQGVPARYACVGANLLAVSPVPAANLALEIRYARGPSVLTQATHVPEIPGEDHAALIDYAVARLRVKEGGQEFGESRPLMGRFLQAVERRAAMVRTRSRAHRYDRVPFELTAPMRAALSGEKPARRNGDG